MRIASLTLDGGVLLLLAPVIGSFLGVVIRRLPDGRELLWSRSRCEACGTGLTARDLIPLLSWMAARGRCRRCGSALGWFYPGVEVAALAVAGIAIFVDGMPGAWLDCLLGWWLLVLGWIDLRCWLLPDILTQPLIVAGLVAAALFDRADLADRALGAVLGYAALRAVAAGYQALRGREGLGGGDAKLLSAAGAWLGVMALPQVVFAAASAGLVAAGALRLGGIRLHAQSALPFGPFIALATWSIWLFGPISW